jgi:hypothetical protein
VPWPAASAAAIVGEALVEDAGRVKYEREALAA